MVIPKAHNEDHTILHGFSHLLKTTLLFEIVLICEDIFDFIAHIIGDRADLFVKFVDFGFWVLNNLSVLNEFSLDLNKVTVIGTIRGMEFSHDSKFLGGINLEL